MGPRRRQVNSCGQLARRRNERNGRRRRKRGSAGVPRRRSVPARRRRPALAAQATPVPRAEPAPRPARRAARRRRSLVPSGTSRSRRSGTISSRSTRSAMSLMPARRQHRGEIADLDVEARARLPRRHEVRPAASRSARRGRPAQADRGADRSPGRARTDRPRSRKRRQGPGPLGIERPPAALRQLEHEPPGQVRMGIDEAADGAQEPGFGERRQARVEATMASLPRAARWRAMATERAEHLAVELSGMARGARATGRNSAGTRSVSSSSRSRARAS